MKYFLFEVKLEIKNKTEYLLQVIKNDQTNLRKELNEKIEKSCKFHYIF